MTAEQPVNFYFGALKQSGIVNEKDTSKDSSNYIILQNDHLHRRVHELETELFELRKEFEELEDENGSLEVSKMSLKGYIKNEGEYSRFSKNLVDYYNENLTKITKIHDQFTWKIKLFGSAFLVLELAIFLLRLYYFDLYGTMEIVLLNATFGYIMYQFLYPAYNNLISIKDIQKDIIVLKIRKEMKECEKGNDYLGDLIDKL